MDRMVKRGFIGKTVALLLTLSMCLLPVQPLRAETGNDLPETAGNDAGTEGFLEYIDIDSVEDLLELSEKCCIDSWSEGRYISLKSDLDLTGIDFVPIPVFSGTFDGGGHTISGFEFVGDGYVTGFFRYIGRTGLVKDLTLQGNVDSENEKECVGSICGVNYGEVKGCTFQGTVSGRDTVGGIAGINEGTAMISDCIVKGRITGYYSTGGITGINHGAVNGCTNHAGINDDSEWVWEDDEMSGLDIIGGSDDVEIYSGVDTGGIAGFSDGIISGCTNEGTVGYEHTGYNIGGIAGRQSGILSLCENNGTVYGRKDVGGIAGQMEPFIEIDEAESLRNAIDKLHDLIEKTIDDMQKTKDVAKSDADVMQVYVDNAIDTGDELVNQISDFADYNINMVNTLTGRMEYVMDMLPPVLDDIDLAGDGLSDLNNTIRRLVDALDILRKIENSDYQETDYERLALLSTVGGTLLSDITSPGENTLVTVTAKADDGYQVKDNSLSVRDAGGNNVAVTRKSDNEYTFIMPKENVVVSAEFTYRGTFLVKSTVGGSVFRAVDGDQETFTAVADSGYEFSHFNVDGSGYNGEYEGDDSNEITLDQREYLNGNRSVVVEAVFDEGLGGAYEVSCVSSTGGSARCDKSSAAEGEEITVTVAARVGYTFKEIEAEGLEVRESSSDANQYIFTMPDHDVAVRVLYAAETDSDTDVYVESSVGGTAYKISGSSDKYTISIIPDSGYTLDENSALEITVTANEDDATAGGEDTHEGNDTLLPGDGDSGSLEAETDPETTMTVALSELTEENNSYKYVLDTKKFAPGKIRVYANFVEEKDDGSDESGTDYAVTSASSTGGRVTTSLQRADEGEKVYITPVSGSGYVLKKLAVTGSGEDIEVTEESDGKQYSFIMPAEKVRVTALFEPIHIILSSNLSGSASCSGNTEGIAALRVKPDVAYTLEGVPVVTDLEGNNIPVSHKQSGSYLYEFDVTEGSAPYTVRITFRKQDKDHTIDTSRDNIRDAIDELEQVSWDVEDTTDRIKDLTTDSDGSLKSWDQLTQDERDELTQEVIQLAGQLGSVTTATSTILSELATIYNVLSPYVSESVRTALDSIEAATDNVQLIIDSLRSATNRIRGIIDYINAQPDISFRGVDDNFYATKAVFHDQLKGLSNSIKALSDNASVNTDLLNDDLRAVNDQFNVVMNLLANRIIDVQELSVEELYEDIDAEDLDSITTGKVEACTNRGIVKGDINVGGIAGSMSIDDEDPEDSAAGKIEYKIGRRFIIKCLVTNSVNEGYVTAKRDGAGGICGYMDHGIIVESEGYGSVESTEGGYVGGICGESLTIIKRCYALCAVSGGSNVGGIAGYADTLQDCYAMVSVEAEKGRSGAIAGQIAAYEEAGMDTAGDRAKVSGNYYVGSDVYGIDNISYVGVAEPISYSELLTVEQIPLQFWHLKVVYRIEDIILGMQEIPYGVRLDDLDYPEIPYKEGFYGIWPDVSERVMEGTYVVQGEYRENITVVKSDSGEEVETVETARIKPYALVTDVFTEDAVLNVAVSSFAPPVEAENKKNVVYEISLTNSGIGENDSFAVRILNPYEKSVIYGYKNGGWTELESKVRGQYLQVEMTGPQEYFCVVEQSSNLVLILGIAAGAAAMCAVLIILIRKVRAGRRKSK